MKHTELKKINKNLRRDCSKNVLDNVLNMYNITGIKETINPNIILLENDNPEEFNIACSNNDSFYLLHGEYSDFSYIRKCQIKEEPNINIDEDGYKEDYITSVNYTEYEDQILGVAIREYEYIEDSSLKDTDYKEKYEYVKRTKQNKYVLSHEIIDEKLLGLGIHMYDYKTWDDPILKNLYIENFVDYFTNSNLEPKLRELLKKQSKVFTK